MPLLSVCWNLSRAEDLTAVVGIRFLALHCSLMPRGKNNLVPVSVGLSVAMKLGNGRLAGVPGRGEKRKEGRVGKAGKEQIGILRAKSVFLFSASVSVPTYPLQRAGWISEPSWGLRRNRSLAPTSCRRSFRGRWW